MKSLAEAVQHALTAEARWQEARTAEAPTVDSLAIAADAMADAINEVVAEYKDCFKPGLPR